MHRRDFLKSMTLAGSAALALPLGTSSWAATGDASARKLIVVMLRGAVDGLNVVAPYADPRYAALRPGIALAPPGADAGVIDLDGYFGLHPALADLQPLWQARELAFVHACGSPDPTRSHFDAQDYMESGTPGRKSTPDGWLNRLLAVLPGTSTPTRALSVGPVLPRILAGRVASTNLASGGATTRADLLDQPALGSAFEQMYRGDPKLARTYQDARNAHREVMAAADMQETAASAGAPLPNGFPADAARLAALMRRDPNIQMAFFALGGWDTHANQGAGRGQLANRLAPLGRGLALLREGLGPMFADTTIVVMSEFGRTAAQNGNGGTDHGHGNVMWVLGGRVAGGKVHGSWPGLEQAQLHEGRDLAVTTDFRTVLRQISRQHLRLDPGQLDAVFPGVPVTSVSWNLMRT
jgi:uncharacterized protein (DUF1501 family)